MTEPRATSTTDATGQDERLMELVEEISDRIRQGEPFAIDDYVRQYPEQGDQLRQMLPTLKAMADLGYAGGDEQDTDDGRTPTPKSLGDFRILRQLGLPADGHGFEDPGGGVQSDKSILQALSNAGCLLTRDAANYFEHFLDFLIRNVEPSGGAENR